MHRSIGNGVPRAMPGETDLHKTLKKEACRWLFRMGYRCIAAEVRPEAARHHRRRRHGPFSAVSQLSRCGRAEPAAGLLCRVQGLARRFSPRPQRRRAAPLCFQDARAQPQTAEAQAPPPTGRRLGKFLSCLMQPMANLHYVLAPAGIVQKKDLPPRWGLLSYRRRRHQRRRPLRLAGIRRDLRIRRIGHRPHAHRRHLPRRRSRYCVGQS